MFHSNIWSSYYTDINQSSLHMCKIYKNYFKNGELKNGTSYCKIIGCVQEANAFLQIAKTKFEIKIKIKIILDFLTQMMIIWLTAFF